MALTDMQFNPTDGLRNTVTYPKAPGGQTAAREQVQGRMDELRDHINNTMIPEITEGKYNYAASTTGTDAYAVTIANIASYGAGLKISVKVDVANTGAASVNVNSLGEVDIRKGGAAATVLSDGDIPAGGIAKLEHDGTYFQLTNPVAHAVNVTANRLVVSDGSGNMSASSVTDTEAGYLSGVTSAIQTQLSAKAAASDLTSHLADTAQPHGAQATPLGINLGFEIWKRGAGPFTVHLAYGPDGWRIYLDGTDTLQIDREGTTKKDNSLYAAKCTYVKGTGTDTEFYQTLVITDGYHFLRGKTITVRIPVKTSTANAIKALIVSNGTSGVITLSSFHPGDNNWGNLDVTYTVPVDATFINFGLQFLASCTAYVDNTMPVIGSKAVDYVALHPADELVRCQRYYEVHGGASSGYPTIAFYAGAGGQYMDVGVAFAVTKGGTPTVTKNGTWTVSNAAQPTATAPNVNGYRFEVAALAAGQASASPADPTTTITAEWNP